MARERHPSEEYPFAVRDGESLMLESSKGWITYELHRDGWWYKSESPAGGMLGDHQRTVVQVARESDAIDEVLEWTERALGTGWFDPAVRERMQGELAAARRARAAHKL